MALQQDGFSFFWHDGRRAGKYTTYSWDKLESFRIRGVAWLTLKLSMRLRDGTIIDCQLGKRMAANADYVLKAKGVPTG